MEPTYKNGSTYFVNKLTYLNSSPKSEDVIAFHHPQNKKYLQLFRVIAVPGDKLKIQDGKVFINNKIITENYLEQGVVTKTMMKTEIKDVSKNAGKTEVINGQKFIEEKQEITIPDNMYFVMGDNREHSADSRSFGLVDKNDILGKLSFQYKLPF